METLEILHMNQGVGETSYAKNSTLQDNIISVTNSATKKAILQILGTNWPTKIGIADLGCSSGPNALRVTSEMVGVVIATSRLLERRTPTEMVVYLNDLFTNDFNNIFASLPSFYRKMKQDKGSHEFGPCYINTVPGTFYGRLFPTNSLHFVHSSSSLHWLSQVPAGLNDASGRWLNKGNIYISKSSPKSVLDAYFQQFENDFSLFLKSRSQEIVSGGRMVLSLMGRDSLDPTNALSCHLMNLLALALMSMVSDGLIEEKKVDSFNVPNYPPCIEEIILEVAKEGSFNVEAHEVHEIELDVIANIAKSDGGYGERVARNVRATMESMLESHFGSQVIDDLFQRFAQIVEDDLLKESNPKLINLVITLVKRRV